MIFVLDIAIGLLVWIPFTLGKSTALLSVSTFRRSMITLNSILQLDPHRFLQILHLPIRAMRIVTDPIVDSVMYIIAALLVPVFGRLLYRVVNLLFLGVLFLISVVFGKHKADKTFEVTSAVVGIHPLGLIMVLMKQFAVLPGS
jgi:E3 ubiquitin-protein ligase MARCH6